jgi:uncharacterized protein (DUF2249 family)
MTAVKTLNLEGAGGEERENLLFPALELDMRRVPMLQRQAMIMEAWQELAGGRTLRLINDREPKPLYFLFKATQRGKFEWSYEKQGPEEWVVAIRKL